MTRNRRLQILNEEEISALYALPQFDSTARAHYFLLPKPVLESLKLVSINKKSTSAKLYFILQYGYFSAKHQFFNIRYQDVEEDVLFIMQTYLPNDLTPHQLPTHKTQTTIRRQILKWHEFSGNIKQVDTLVIKKVSKLVKITQNLRELFHEMIHAVDQAKLMLPSYSRLQDLIGSVLKKEDQRLINSVKLSLTKLICHALQRLFESEDGLYAITELKLDAKSFQKKEMTVEINKLNLCKSIYMFAKQFLPQLKLSRRMIDHYADLAKLYSVQRLQRTAKELAYLYVICYIHSRYERLMNNLTQGFIYYVDKYQDDSKSFSKNQLASLKFSMNPLEQHQQPIGELLSIFTNKKTMSLPGYKIKRHAFKILPEKDIISISQALLDSSQHNKRDLEQAFIWEYPKQNYQAIIINLRPLFLAIDFESQPDLKDLFQAIEFLKSIFQQEKSFKDIPYNTIPVAHIKPHALLKIFTEVSDVSTQSISAEQSQNKIGKTDTKNRKNRKKQIRQKEQKKQKKMLNLYQYEFYTYKAIREYIRSHKIHINSSVDYKSFETEIKITPNWNREKDTILKNLNNPILLRPIDETLAELESILESLIQRTNQRALNGENKHIKITHHRDGRIDWTIPYPKQNIEIDNPFYDQLEIKTISEIFDFVEQECHFMQALSHIKPRNAKNKNTPDYLAIKGVILANGTMQGTHEFSKRSNMGYQRLRIAEQNYIRLNTLRDAADIIVDHMINLPIFNNYDLSDKKHGSGDGTKKKTKRRIIKARFSRKYFGTDIGIVIMTMILNHVPFVTKIIGANEHESHYLYSMLQEYQSMIDPDIISTDTAGANNVNDFMYYLIGKIHAPCYRSTVKKAKTICGFNPLSDYKNLLIQPSEQVNIKLIKKKWSVLLPILVSMLSHETNQKNIIKSLSSHEYKSDVKEALWELNKILKSIHLLKYIDDPTYRRDIRTALNRGEAYHQLIDKIMAVGGGDFRGMSELEVEIWNECTRLIALIIIYYNMYLLSKLYEIALEKNDTATLEYLKHLSPVASQHLNISGLYEFNEIITPINVDNIVETLQKILEKEVNSSAFATKKNQKK